MGHTTIRQLRWELPFYPLGKWCDPTFTMAMIPILRCWWKVKLGNQDEGKNRSQIPSEKIGYRKFEENMLACTAEGLCSERECGIIYWKTVLPSCLASRLHWIDIRACSTITIWRRELHWANYDRSCVHKYSSCACEQIWSNDYAVVNVHMCTCCARDQLD